MRTCMYILDLDGNRIYHMICLNVNYTKCLLVFIGHGKSLTTPINLNRIGFKHISVMLNAKALHTVSALLIVASLLIMAHA